MLNKKYKSSSITIKGANHQEFPSGNSKKSRRRDVRGMTTHGAGIVDGMVKGSGANGLQGAMAKSAAQGRGVGTEKLPYSAKESMAKGKAMGCDEKKVDNSGIKITMGMTPVGNEKRQVSGTYINNKLHTIESNFKRRKK